MNDEYINEFEIVIALYNKLNKFDYIEFIIDLFIKFDENNELKKYFIEKYELKNLK